MGRYEDLEERVRVLELCLEDIEKRLKLKRRPVPPREEPVPSLELPRPTGKPVRNGRPGGPVQR